MSEPQTTANSAAITTRSMVEQDVSTSTYVAEPRRRLRRFRCITVVVYESGMQTKWLSTMLLLLLLVGKQFSVLKDSHRVDNGAQRRLVRTKEIWRTNCVCSILPPTCQLHYIFPFFSDREPTLVYGSGRQYEPLCGRIFA